MGSRMKLSTVTVLGLTCNDFKHRLLQGLTLMNTIRNTFGEKIYQRGIHLGFTIDWVGRILGLLDDIV